MMSIRADNRHLYLQVIDKIKQNIEKGIFKEKERLPSEFDLTRFACGEDEQILFVERVRTANGEPVVYCMDKVPQKILPENFEYKQESLLEILEKQAGKHISYAVANIEPLGYHEKVSPILQCEPETALLVLKQMHYDQHDEPILYSINYFKADQFSFQVLRKRV